MPDLIDLIQQQHARLLELLDALAGDPVADPPPPAERKRLSDRLIAEASAHEAAEEEHLWPVVRRTVDEGDGLADAALEQEGAAKRLLHDLDHIGAGSVEFDTLVRHVASELHDHVTFEESVVLPALRLRLGSSEVATIGAAFEQTFDHGPTRPHPHTPPVPAVLRTAGRAVAAVDRARDALTRRGRRA